MQLCVLFYSLGYERAVGDYDMERLHLEEEKRRNQEEYRQMCDLFSSYVEKASLELKRIHGDELCDVASMRREVKELRESLALLKCTFASFSQAMQASMQELNSVISKCTD